MTSPPDSLKKTTGGAPYRSSPDIYAGAGLVASYEGFRSPLLAQFMAQDAVSCCDIRETFGFIGGRSRKIRLFDCMERG
jgi:hypothetical protein